MSNKPNVETELEERIRVGFGSFNDSYATFYETYKQGYLDGIKTIDKINEAYNHDINKET